MARMFKSFEHFKSHLFGHINKLPLVLRPTDINKTMRHVWSTAFRAPDYLLEPKFLEIFGKDQLDYPPKSEVATRAKEVRQTASELVQHKKPVEYFKSEKNFTLIKLATGKTNSMLKLKNQQFEPVSPKVAAERLPKNTSSGFPDYIQNKGTILDTVVSQAMYCLNNGITDWKNYLCTMAWRTQVRKSGLKYRIIWVTSYIAQVFENCFFTPISLFFEQNKQTPWCVGNVFTDLVPRLKHLRMFQRIVVIDYKSFDQTIPAELVLHFFSAIKPCFKINSDLWNKQYEAIMYYNTYCVSFNMYDGHPTLFRKNGSVSSGSVFTNFIDSWINLFLMNLYLLENGFDPDNQYLNVMGDDCTHGFDFDFDVHHYASWLLANFGMIVKPDECQVLGPDFNTIEFLGANINEEGRYIDRALVIDQLCISSRFIPESVMPEAERLVSKVASITFKFTDGWQFFDEIMASLLPRLNLDHVPEYYTQLFYSAAGPFETGMRRRVIDYKYNGWMIQ